MLPTIATIHGPNHSVNLYRNKEGNKFVDVYLNGPGYYEDNAILIESLEDLQFIFDTVSQLLKD